MKKVFKYKIIPLILIFSMIMPMVGGLSYPKQVKAVVPNTEVNPVTLFNWYATSLNSFISATIDSTQLAIKVAEIQQSWIERALTAVARLFVRALIMTLTQSIVNWINSGFQGSPSFMTDPAGMIRNAADQAIGQYILQGPLNFLCEPFQLQVKLNLGLQYGGYNSGISCTLSGVLGNIQGAYDDFVGGDFIGGGGWDSWMQMASNPENTPQGAAMMAEGALEVKLAGIEKISLLEADWGSGSLSLKKCKEATFEVKEDPGSSGGKSRTLMGARTFVGHPGYATGTSISATHESVVNDTGGHTIINQEKETTCETTTPGAVIMDTMNITETSWIRTLELESTMSDSINAIIGAFATLAVKTTLNTVMGGIFGKEQDNTDYRGQMLQQLDEFQKNESNNFYKNPTSSSTDFKIVDEAISNEKVNLENITMANTTLNAVKSIVMGSIRCSDLTTDLIRANVVDNIDGISNQKRTKPDVYFNLGYIRNLASTTKNRILKLEDIRNKIQTISSVNVTEKALSALSDVQSGDSTKATTTTVATLNSIVGEIMLSSSSTQRLNKDIEIWLDAELVNKKTAYAQSSCVSGNIGESIEDIIKQSATYVPQSQQLPKPVGSMVSPN